MTHLYIEQDTSLTEEVNSSIIAKLYELATSGDLDLTSDLKGRLHSSTARDTHISYFLTHYPDLYITATTLYITFQDPEVDRILTLYWGDGVGVTAEDISTHNSTEIKLGTETIYPFKNNTTITNFNELGRFTSIKNISHETFYGTTNLTSIDLSNIEKMAMLAFRGSGITGVVNLPSFVKFTDRNCFTGCTNITLVNFGSNFESFAYGGLFLSCSNLTRVTGLSNITSLPSDTFNGCSSLSNIDIDLSKITSIGPNCFRGCNNLSIQTVSMPNLTSIGSRAFENCKNITTVSNLGLITTLSDFAFNGCSNLTSITFPSTLLTLYCQAVQGADITSIVGPEGVTTMSFSLFDNKNNNFAYIEVPSTVTDMRHFFHNSLRYQSDNSAICVIKATNPPALGYYNGSNGSVIYDPTDPPANTTAVNNGAKKFLGIYVPDASLNDYLAAPIAWQEPNVLAKLKPISQLLTDSPTYWAVYQSGLSNS